MPGGRPLKFETVEIMQEQIDAYFKECKKDDVPLTITGLALALDTSRETLCNYEEREEYFDAIKRAKLKCENYAEVGLFTAGNVAGPIFALKNFGWKDKFDVENSGTLTHKHDGVSRSHEILEGFRGIRPSQPDEDTLPN